jgi:hypothetical protein
VAQTIDLLLLHPVAVLQIWPALALGVLTFNELGKQGGKLVLSGVSGGVMKQLQKTDIFETIAVVSQNF